MAARLWQRLTALLAAIAGWRFFKPAVFVACLIPGVLLGIRLHQVLTGTNPDALGVDPKATLLHQTGETALAILLITLSVTPFRRIFKINRIQAVRRMLGVFSFTYALLHLSIYLVFDQLCYSWATCDFSTIWEDILKRKFIFVGQSAFLILLLLAITSTTGWMRRLKKNWQRLHRLVYVAAIAGIVHFIWIQKSDISEPLNWAYWLAALLAIRVYFAIQKKWTPRGALAPRARAAGVGPRGPE
jgi:sulfoxide reductase heme-binding subunit YedZ